MAQNRIKNIMMGSIISLSIIIMGACSKVDEVEISQPKIEAAIEPGIEVEVPEPGGSIITYLPRSVMSIDPYLTGSREVNQLLTLCYEKLISYNNTLKLTPSLAESWDAEDDEATSWRISLREGVTWHDGSKFTAADVIASIDLLKREDYSQSPYSYHMNKIAEYSLIDEYTMRIKGTQPGTFVLHALTFPVISEEAFKHSAKVIGTGPYKLVMADRANGLRFDANENWWRTKPLIQSVIAKRILDNNAALKQINANQINFIATDSLTATSFRELGRIAVIEVPSQQSEVLIINHNRSLLKDKNLRKALAYGVDRRDIISKAYLGHAFVTDVPIQPDSWLYSADSKVYDYNPTMAASLLRQSGWIDLNNDGFLEKGSDQGGTVNLTLRLLVNDTPGNTARKDVASLIKKNFADIGIELQVMMETWSNNNTKYLSRLREGDFDLALVGFEMDKCPDLMPFISANGEENYGKYSKKEMEENLNLVAQAANDDELKENMDELQRMFIDELPFIQLYFRSTSLLFNDSLTLEGSADIQENNTFANIERWHFNAQGRSFSNETEIKGDLESEWSFFDKDTIVQEQMEEEERPEDITFD